MTRIGRVLIEAALAVFVCAPQCFSFPLPPGFESVQINGEVNQFVKERPGLEDRSSAMSLGSKEPRLNNTPEAKSPGWYFRETISGNEFYDQADYVFSQGKLSGIYLTSQPDKSGGEKGSYIEALLELYGEPLDIGIFNGPQRDTIALYWNFPEGRIYGLVPLHDDGRLALQITSAEVVSRIDPDGKAVSIDKSNSLSPDEQAEVNRIVKAVKEASERPSSSGSIPDQQPKSTSTPAPIAMPSPVQTPEPKPVATPVEAKQATRVPIIPVVIIAAVIVGVIAFLLRRKSP